MTFIPSPELNDFICEILVSGVSNITTTAASLVGLDSITYDTGGQIQLSSNIITLPANCDIYIKTGISAYGRGTANGGFYIRFVDADTNIDIDNQSIGLTYMRPVGSTASIWMAGLETYMIKLSSPSSQRIKILAQTTNSAVADILAPNSANAYRPNSTIFIMYTGS